MQHHTTYVVCSCHVCLFLLAAAGGTTYNVAVSALVPETATPNQIFFPQLLARANANPPRAADIALPFSELQPAVPKVKSLSL
jgi:hypothetical protein